MCNAETGLSVQEHSKDHMAGQRLKSEKDKDVIRLREYGKNILVFRVAFVYVPVLYPSERKRVKAFSSKKRFFTL